MVESCRRRYRSRRKSFFCTDRVVAGAQDSELAAQVAALSSEVELMLEKLENMEDDDILSEPEMRSMETALADIEQRASSLNTSVSTLE